MYIMALHIDAKIERLATEVAAMTGESATETVRRPLVEQRRSLAEGGRTETQEERDRRIDESMRWLREEVWPTIPPEARGKPIPKEKIDALDE